MSTILYSGTKNASSWAMRAWLALRAAGVVFDERVVDIRRPQRFANLRDLAGISPTAMVPLLVVDDVVIFDSLAIMEYANEACDGRLLPTDRGHRAAARSWLAWQHAGLSGICPRLSFESSFYDQKRRLSDREREEIDRFFCAIEHVFAREGHSFLFGQQPSLADFALVPTILRLTSHRPDLTIYPRADEWTNRLLGLNDVVTWIAEASKEPVVWLEDYIDHPNNIPLTHDFDTIEPEAEGYPNIIFDFPAEESGPSFKPVPRSASGSRGA